MTASTRIMLDLLSLFLDDSCVIILDGIDECEDSDALVKNMLDISIKSNTKLLMLSRINMLSLQRSIKTDLQLPMSKKSVSKDIRLFLGNQLDEL